MLALAVLFYAASILFGIGIVSYFMDKAVKDTLVKYAFAFPIGFASAPFIVVVQDMLAGGFGDWQMAVAAAVMLASFLFLYRKSSGAQMYRLSVLKKQVSSAKLFHAVMFAMIAFFFALQIAGVYHNSLGIVGGDNYGTDFLFHISIGNSLIYTGWPPKLLYADYARNVFPFIADFYTSMLSFNGMPYTIALYMMNLPLYFSITFATVYLITLLTRRRLAAAFGFFTFIFCSLGFSMVLLYVFHAGFASLPYSQVQALAHHPISLLTTVYFNFSDPMESNFAPQHDYVLGWPFTMIILSVLYATFFDKPARRARNYAANPSKPLLLVAAMTGMLPLVHPFSLIFVFIFAAVAFVYSMFWRERKRIFVRQWVPFAVIVLALAIPQILYIKSGTLAPGFFGLVLNQQFWNGSSLLTTILLHVWFWFAVMGTIVVTGIVGMYLLRKHLIAFLPAFIALAVINIMRFSPQFGDSNKITMYFLLFMGAATAELYYVLWKRGMAFKALAAFLFIAIVLSGVIAEYYDLVQGGYPVASNLELNMSQWALTNTPQNATFVDSCYNTVFGITSSIAARRTLMEINDYIPLAGIYNYNPNLISAQIQNFMLQPNCGFVGAYNVSYVVIENLSTFAQGWCDAVNLTAFYNSSQFLLYKQFGSGNNMIQIYRPVCGG